MGNFKASTLRDLGTAGKFFKNYKFSFISDDMLIIGCDIGSETYYVRAIDERGKELSRKALTFENSAEGFQNAKEWVVGLATANEKTQIIANLVKDGVLQALHQHNDCDFWLCFMG